MPRCTVGVEVTRPRKRGRVSVPPHRCRSRNRRLARRSARPERLVRDSTVDDSTSRGRGSGVGSVGCFVRHWSPRCSTRWPDLHVLDRPLIAASGPGASRCLRFAHQVSTPPASSENCFSRSRGSADQVLLRRSIRNAITACCSCRSRRSTRAARCAGRARQRRSRRIQLVRRGSST